MNRRSFPKRSAVGIGTLLALVLGPAAHASVPAAKGLGTSQGFPSSSVQAAGEDVATLVYYWRDLQTRDNGPIVKTGIDNALATAASRGILVRLRVLAGRYSPTWVMSKVGSVVVTDPTDGITATVPRFWKTSFQGECQQFSDALAAIYNGRVSAISVVCPMTIWGEPFLRGAGSTATRTNLCAAGFTAAADKAGLLRWFDDMDNWTVSRKFAAFNPYQSINCSSRTWSNDLAFTNSAMDHFRADFPYAILQNNSMRSSWITSMPGPYGTMYDHMKALGKPLNFQTAGSARVGDCEAVMQWMDNIGASMVENQCSLTELPLDRVTYWDAIIEGN